MRLFPATPPPGPFRPGFFRSPLRGPWLTSMLGSLLLVAMTLVAVTGLLSHAAYQPDLGFNAIVPRNADAPLLNIGWPTHPSWLYALTQGTHVTLGILAVPLLLAKLWSVIPRLFAWPPVASAAQAVERLSLLALVGGAVFQFATGIVNAQVYYPFKFGFVTAHYYGAWVFMSALAIHVAREAADDPPRLPRARRAQAAARVAGADAARAPRARRPRLRAPRRADAHPPRAVRRGRRDDRRAVRRDRRAVDRRPAAPRRAAGPAWARPRQRPERLRGQQDRGDGADHAADDRRRTTA